MEYSPEFKDKYRWRSGIEATFSEMDKKTGVKRLRVRGLPAVAYFARLKAIAVNLFRATGCPEGARPPRRGPCSGKIRHSAHYFCFQRAVFETYGAACKHFHAGEG
jgi:hypothetical protein